MGGKLLSWEEGVLHIGCEAVIETLMYLKALKVTDNRMEVLES